MGANGRLRKHGGEKQDTSNIIPHTWEKLQIKFDAGKDKDKDKDTPGKTADEV